MTTRYEFVPGRGSHYTGKIRSFVLRNKKVRKRKAVQPQQDAGQLQLVALGDAKNLLEGRLDPFQTMAAQLSPWEDKLLYHCMGLPSVPFSLLTLIDIEACIPHLGRRSKDSFFPPRDIDWPLIREDAVVMVAAVQFAAMSLAFVESSQPETLLFAAQSRAKVLHMFRQKLEKEDGIISDNLIHGFIGIIATDTCIRNGRQSHENQRDNMHLHIKGLRAVLKARGGWDMGLYHPTLQWELQL